MIDTQKEHEQIVHLLDRMPDDPAGAFKAVVDERKRTLTMNNHSATHLMHAALRKVLGNHVEQKGSLVDENRLRFDFSHFARLTEEEIRTIEDMVNRKIRENIPIQEMRDLPMQQALDMGAVALFGEKYGEQVRVITFDRDYSVELCGGTHVAATGQIGFFKIVSEGAIAAGIRRVEAITADRPDAYIHEQDDTIRELRKVFKSQKHLLKGVNQLLEENAGLRKELESMKAHKATGLRSELARQAKKVGGVNLITACVDLDMSTARDLAFKMNQELDDLVLLLATASEGKVNLSLMISENLVESKNLNAGSMIREIAREIGGGGGGQPHFATAGGKNADGIEKAFAKLSDMIGG